MKKTILFFLIASILFSCGKKIESVKQKPINDSIASEFKSNFLTKEEIKSEGNMADPNLSFKIYNSEKKEKFEVLINPPLLYKLISFLDFKSSSGSGSAGESNESLTTEEFKFLFNELDLAKRKFIRDLNISNVIDKRINEFSDGKPFSDDSDLTSDLGFKKPLLKEVNEFLDSLANAYKYKESVTRIGKNDKITTIGKCKETVKSKIIEVK